MSHAEEVGRVVLRLARPPRPGARVIRGAVTVADERGARVEPWYLSATAEVPLARRVAQVGEEVRGARTSTLTFERPRPQKRDARTRAEELAVRFVAHLRARERLLGRPIRPEDLSEEEYRAFGAEFWRRGEPVSVETMRKVAAIYLDAAARGASRDPRWTPDGRGFAARRPNLADLTASERRRLGV